MYADYFFYTSEYFGELIPEEEFQSFAARASAFLDYYTRGKARDNAELYALKMACCAVAEKQKLAAEAQASGGGVSAGVKSETVGSYSVTYLTALERADAAEGVRAQCAAVAREYLADTGLLYRGRRCACTLPTL